MRSSSTRRRRIGGARIAAAWRRGAVRKEQSPPCATSLRDTLLLVPRPASLTAAPFILLARRAARRSPTGCSTRRRRSTWSLATGQDQGAYAEFGKRYAADPEGERHRGASCEPTAGAAENLAPACASPTAGVDIAFVRAAPTRSAPRGDGDDADDGLVSLGSLFYEPVWLFYRGDSASACSRRPS